MNRQQLTRIMTLISMVALLFGGFVIFMLVSVGVMNTELYGRLTETHTLPTPYSKNENDPLVRLVLHKIVPDENAIEASLLLIVPATSDLGVEIKAAGTTAKAVVEDGSSAHVHAMTAETQVIDAAAFSSGSDDAVVRSARFLLPTYQSIGTYPFDDYMVRPMILIRTKTGPIFSFKLEVQKALPGRLLSETVSGGIPVVILKRAFTEKSFIITASLVFVLLSLAVTASLFFSSRGVSSFEQMIAIASYLVAAGGFRALLGVSRVPGTTILEIVILGIPLVLLSFGVAFSVYRGRRSTSA